MCLMWLCGIKKINAFALTIVSFSYFKFTIMSYFVERNNSLFSLLLLPETNGCFLSILSKAKNKCVRLMMIIVHFVLQKTITRYFPFKDYCMNNKSFKGFALLLAITILFCGQSFAQIKKNETQTLSTSGSYTLLKQLADEDSSRLVDLFKDFHLHPELAFTETRTAGILAKELRALGGYEVFTGIGKTGLAAVLHNGNGPTVMYRADMDALPVKETTGLPWASTASVKKDDGSVVPLMHACGHDAHITWLLGVAKLMLAIKDKWHGTLVFVVQPAEEVIGGAVAMVKDGLYDKVPLPDYLFGMHTMPYAVGYFENRAGYDGAGSTGLEVIFHGIGAHGSAPHLAKDPVIMAANAILDYQAVVSRSVSTLNPHVITVGSVEAGTVANIIPDKAVLKITTRWYEEKDRDAMIKGIKRVDSGIAMMNGLPYDLYPTEKMYNSVNPLKNDTAMSIRLNAALLAAIPGLHLETPPARMGSEDFPYLIINSKKDYVYDYIHVGVSNKEACAKQSRDGKTSIYGNHNPNFAVDLSAIPYGTIIGASALLELFK